MEHIYGMKNIKLSEESIVILGNFDGIHIGHQKLFQLAKQVGNEKKLQTVLFSFYPHPTWVVGNNPKPLLMTREEKKDRIDRLGIDVYVEYPFSKAFGQMSALNFAKEILLQKLNCKAVIIGNNYFFGKNKEGNAEYMKALGRQFAFEVFVVHEMKLDQRTISSTLIRELLLKGQLALANELIGEAYTIKGEVVKGNQLGRTLGFPTANLLPAPTKVLPPNGVYISKNNLLGKQYYGLTNIGYKPTVKGRNKTVETFIFDFHGSIYQEELSVQLVKYLRPEIKFDSLEELTNQMQADQAIALKYIEDL